MLEGPKAVEDDEYNMLHESMMNQSILVEDYEQSPVGHFDGKKGKTLRKED